MKTKHIFSAFMLATLAAACTNEEFEAVNSNVNAEGRIELGQITLSLDDEANTRYAVGPNFNDLTAEIGDELGACLIDIPNGSSSEKEPKSNYKLTDYISTNYSFKFDGSAWVSEAKMVEGNYMFYAPYNAEHATRKPITAKLNPVQQLALNADGTIDELSTIKELKESGEVMVVGHKFISAEDGKIVSAKLLPIYAYPLVALTNSYKEKNGTYNESGTPTDLVINQIVVTKTKGFTTTAEFDFDGTNGTSNWTAITATDGFVANLRNFSYVDEADQDKVKEKKGVFAENNGSKAAYTNNLMNTNDRLTSSAIVVKAPNNAYTLKAGTSMQFHVVIPAASYNSNKLTIEVYTNKGVFTVDNIDGTIAAGKRYPCSEYNGDGSLINPSEAGDAEAGDVFSVNMERPGTASENVVATTEDLVTLINNYNAGTETQTLSIKPLNEDVEVNAAVMSAIRAKANTQLTVKFTASATISTNINTNKTVEFAAGAVIKEGTITLSDGAKFSTTGSLTIKGGTVTIDGAEFATATIVNNGGEVVVKSNITTLNNTSGSVSLESKDATGTIVNAGGTVNVKAGTAASQLTYTATINNEAGTLNVGQFATISTAIAANGGVNKATIENYGTLTVAENTAKGTINNYGTLTVKNNGFIDMKTSSSKVTLSADGSGRIKNNADAIINNASDEDHVIYYEFTDNVNGALVPQCGIYNTIVLNGMTWAPTADATVKANFELTNATISVYTPEITIKIDGGVYVNNGTSAFKGNTTSKIYIKGDVTADTYGHLTVSNVTVKKNDSSLDGSNGGEVTSF